MPSASSRLTVGRTVWRTSILPSNSDKTYVLPIKKAVRQAEGLKIGGTATVLVTLVDVPNSD